MAINCFHCNTSTSLTTHFEATFFGCPACGTIYYKNEGGDFVFKDRLKKLIYHNSFEIGQKATINSQEYTVVGYLIKGQGSYANWIEYVLQNNDGNFLYLSESSGNFILLEKIEFVQKVGNHPLEVDYEEKTYDRYDYCYPTLKYAAGYFDFNVLEKIELIEYIHPPYILSFEKLGKEQTAFFGKHISRRAVKKAFQTTVIPAKTEVGIAEPFLINFRNLVLTFSSVAILILLTHWYINQDRVEQEVLNVSLEFDQYKSKDYISPSFELKGSSAPLQISLYTDVNNSWANVQVALINEKNNEEIYASKDVEYYHGYTDGENWSEGDNTEDFNICGVSAGKYHLAITPMKAPEDLVNSQISVKATWNKPSLRNFFMVVIFMVVLAIIVYYLSRLFEDKRWGVEY